MDELQRLEARMRELENRLGRTESEMMSLRSDLIELARQHRDLAARMVPSNQSSQTIPNVIAAPSNPVATRPLPSPTTFESTRQTVAPADARPLAYQQPEKHAPEPSWISVALEQFLVRLRTRIGDIPVEEFVGMNLLNKIGILILVLGASFFLKIAYDWIGPGVKVTLLALASIAIIVVGDFFYRRKNYVVFGLGLISGGMVVLFFTAYASYNYDATRIIPTDLRYVGYAVQIALAGLMILGTLRYNRESITSFAYFLSFLCVSVNETGEFNHFSLAVIGLLAASLILIITIKRWKYLAGLGILATYSNFVLYSMSLPRGPDGYVVSDESNYFLFSLIYLSIYWIVFHVSVFSMKTETKPEQITGVTVNIANASAFLGLVTYIRPEPTLWGGLIIFGTLGAIYVISAIAARQIGRDYIWKSSIVIGASFIALGLGLRFSGTSLVLVWLMQATILVICGYLFQETYLRNLGYVTFLLKIGGLFAIPTAGAIHQGQDVWNLDFQLNRASVYVAIILSTLSIQIVARPFKRNSADQAAWHILGGMLILAAVLLSAFVIALPHQAILLAPIALGLVISARLTSIRAHIAYGSILFVLALFFSFVILFQGPGYKSNLDSLFVICTLLIAPLVAFLLLVGPLQSQDVRQDVQTTANPWYLATTSNLFVSLIALISLVVNYAPETAIALLFVPVALLLLYSDRKTQHGKFQFLALCVFTFFLTLWLQVSLLNGKTDRITFLCNASVLWLLTTGAFYLTEGYRKSRITSIALTFVSSVEALMILYQIGDPQLFPAFVAAYSLAVLLACIFFETTVLPAVLLNALALVIGPIRQVATIADVTSAEARIDLVLLCFLFMISAIRTWIKKGNPYFNYFYYSTIAAIACTIYAILPLEFHPLAFSCLAVISILLISNFPRHGMELSWKLLTFISMISFIYMLVKMNMQPQLQPDWLKGILGIVPLGLIGFSTRLYSESLPPGTDPRKDSFRTFVILTIFLLLVALTMTLIDARYWSVAWAVEATSLVLFGLVWRMAVLRYTGMALIAIMLAKVAFWDLKNLEDTVRVAVLIAIGLLLVGASFLYARFKDRFIGDANETV